ncbi:replication control protein Cdc46 [Natrinema saccharevitans]|uniref:DNA helicase n=1 Tax=Natrinema saccharevitans TaxID=301967 RepID=A0A1S8AR42_9EURY|nr:minichromosome maintenance protein MCM [Natrinema saccharevitans]OLZ39076.1 replication control protein Cdc46 [Natrinema saccharevitans]
MDDEWIELFEGPLSEYADSASSNGRVRIPWTELSEAHPDLAESVLSDPETTLKVASNALGRVGPVRTTVRVYDLPDHRTYRVGKYGSSMLGNLIGVRGTVVDVNRVKPCAREAAFECHLCGTLTRVPQSGGDLIEPGQCQGCEQDGGMRLNLAQSEVIDYQRIILERANSSMDDPPVEIVHLWKDLCETLSPGDTVTVVGIYDILPNQDKAVLETYLDAVSINNSKQPATVDEMADWQVKKWTFETADELCTAGSDYDCSKREIVETVADEHGVAEGEITAALEDLDDQSVVSERRGGRIHITTSSPPTFEPAE